jgi:hypothetical protein
VKPGITIIKRNHLGEEVISYKGKVLQRSADEILIEAAFSLDHAVLIDIPLNRGDRFLETYFSKHWYNIYEIRDCADNSLKGWYCNVSYPAEIGEGLISFSDLVLDLVVYPDGRQVVLDEDEFQALGLDPSVQAQARTGLAELQRRFEEKFRRGRLFSLELSTHLHKQLDKVVTRIPSDCKSAKAA